MRKRHQPLPTFDRSMSPSLARRFSMARWPSVRRPTQSPNLGKSALPARTSCCCGQRQDAIQYADKI
jgi:hypothetical protein